MLLFQVRPLSNKGSEKLTGGPDQTYIQLYGSAGVNVKFFFTKKYKKCKGIFPSLLWPDRMAVGCKCTADSVSATDGAEWAISMSALNKLNGHGCVFHLLCSNQQGSVDSLCEHNRVYPM